MRIQFTKVSENRKLGPMATTIQSGDTCPPTCPLKGNGCYAEHGPLKWRWDQVERGAIGGPWEAMLGQIRDVPAGRMFRYGQAGDLPYCGSRSSEVGVSTFSRVDGEGCGNRSSEGGGSGEGNTGRLDDGKCMQLAEAASHLHSFLYTHYPVLPSAEVTKETAEHNLAVLKGMHRRKFVVNLSADNLEEADKLAETGLPVVVVLPAPSLLLVKDAATVPLLREEYKPATHTPREEYKPATHTPGGRRIVVCPHYTKGMQCIDCKLCARSQRKVIVGFPAHGAGKGKASKVALG